MAKIKYRREHDFIGALDIEDSCYYGIQTFRAKENFPISGIPLSYLKPLIVAFGYVKKACAMANMRLNQLPKDIGEAIVQACDEVIAGHWNQAFVVDVFQGGAGTSTNMNANEVIANRALEILGHAKGDYDRIHPNNHVNCSQSTNDTYPTAVKLALYFQLKTLVDSVRHLQQSFRQKAQEFTGIYKMGRTQLQDAVPMTLSQEFNAFAMALNDLLQRADRDQDLILTVNLGATAIGTGINAPKGYADLAVSILRDISNVAVEKAEDLLESTWDANAFVQISSTLKQLAIKLSKICNDLRLLSSGPRAGLNEIHLPQLQPGSSIMPGKVNPVIPEVVNQVAFKVIGADLTVTLAAEAGQLQLNVMEPVIAFSLFSSIFMLNHACRVLADRCIDGITANAEQCQAFVENSVAVVTALNPYIGYEKSAAIAKEALSSGRSVYALMQEKQWLDEQTLAEALDIRRMVATENLPQKPAVKTE